MVTHDDTFLYRFRVRERVFRLADDEVQELQQAAAEGDAYAQYGYGRWLYYHNPDDDALHRAEQLFEAAKDAVPDALAAYAQMWRYGETRANVMDVECCHELMRTAIAQGSELAEQQRRLHDVVDERLRRGLQLGEGICGYFLYTHYYYGGLGYTTDTTNAFAYWSTLRQVLAQRGILWQLPGELNPEVMFD
ncbi:MAG: hypothetical protein IJ739_04085 [Bacteroidaceae bacterium]|nr:hypothetical protein [Bacteroidaceae bacterium]